MFEEDVINIAKKVWFLLFFQPSFFYHHFSGLLPFLHRVKSIKYLLDFIFVYLFVFLFACLIWGLYF